MGSWKTPDKEIGLNVSFYVENASTGRFRRYLVVSEGESRSNRWSILAQQNSVAAGNETDEELNVLPFMTQGAFVCFLFLQGILSGLSLSALFEALTPQQPDEFVAQYSAARANEIRRYFFIGITFCATGSLCILNKHETTQVLASMTGGNSPNSKASTSTCYLILIYSFALVITIVCSHEDVLLLDFATHITEQEIHASTNNIRSVLHRWRGLSVSRSIFCIVGWLISCYRFVITNNVQRDR